MLTEPVNLCQRDVTLTVTSLTDQSINLQMKTTCYMREVSIKLAYCNRNFATWPFSHQTRNIFKKDIRRLSNTDDKRNQIRWF